LKSIFNSKTNIISNTSESENKEEKKLILNEFSILFSKEYLNILSHENETNRKIYIDILYKYLIKFFVLNKFTIDFNKIDNSQKDLINNIEDFFINEIYDNNIEIRQMSLTIFNLILSSFPKSEYFKPICDLFESIDHNVNILQALQYLDEDNKKIGVIFKDFKNIFSIVINLYIDEKISFGSLCDNCFRNFIEKFPIYCINELVKAQKKGQLNRIEELSKIYKKHMKNK